MKKRIVYLLFAALGAALTFTGCNPEPQTPKISVEQQAFMDKAVYGVYSGDTEAFVYTEETGQYVMGESEKSVRIQTDDMTKYFSMTFAEDPVIDKDIDVVLATNIGGNIEGNYKMRILKIEDGKLWAWEPNSKKGYMVPW